MKIFTNWSPLPTLEFKNLDLLSDFGEILMEKSFECYLKDETKLQMRESLHSYNFTIFYYPIFLNILCKVPPSNQSLTALPLLF